MATKWMSVLGPGDERDSDVDHGFQLSCRYAWNHGTVSQDPQNGVRRPRALQVLVVDDDRDTADGLVTLMRRWGHDACAAYDGVSALRVASVSHFDVVLLNIEMRRMDGCRVARKLRLDLARRSCLIIASTLWPGHKCETECSEAGIDLLLRKPVTPAMVKIVLRLECTRLNRLPADDAVMLATHHPSCNSLLGSVAL
jgi:two-component system, OmpR family, response regulator